jgi:hypothetical protein
LIRTALTLNISPQDSQRISYLVNGTHLGLLSQSAQNIHVQTNHRPLQLIVAIRSDETASGPALTWQRQQINAWQSFYQLLSRRGSADLSSMIVQYHLKPDWLICLDEQRLQAWLPADAGFYLLRQETLRRLRPVMLHEMDSHEEETLEDRQYYALSVAMADQFYILPPALLGFFSTGEASGILTGLRQLPARMSDLFNTARARGFSAGETWLALQITHHEPDELPDLKTRLSEKTGRSLFSILRPNSFPQEKLDKRSDSLSLSDGEAQTEQWTNRPLLQQFLSSRRFWLVIGIGLSLVAILVLALVIGRALSRQPGETTTALTTVATTSKPTPSPTVKPTTVQTTTAALPQLVVIAQQLNLREKPERDSTLITTLKNGDLLSQLAEPDGDWVKVRTADGLVGYVFYVYVDESVP